LNLLARAVRVVNHADLITIEQVERRVGLERVNDSNRRTTLRGRKPDGCRN
jgi:hypothetical protein